MKYEKLYNTIVEIIDWAENQGHITEDARNILQSNIYKKMKEIEEEE